MQDAKAGADLNSTLRTIWGGGLVDDPMKLQPKLVEMADCVPLAMHGIPAMLRPEPKLAALEAVDYVWPKNNSSSDIGEHLPRIGKLITSCLRRDPALQERGGAFKKHYGAELVHGDDVVALEVKITLFDQSVKDASYASPTSALDVCGKFSNGIPT